MLAMLLGNLIACKLSDWYGRRFTFLGVSILMGVGQGLSALAIDPYSYAVARFLAGMGLSGNSSILASKVALTTETVS